MPVTHGVASSSLVRTAVERGNEQLSLWACCSFFLWVVGGGRGAVSGTSSVPEARDYGRVVDDDDVWDWGFVMVFVMYGDCGGD